MSGITLKDGTEVSDRRLDRLIEFDERSRNFPIRSVVGGKKPRSYTWRILATFLIDQGREGACVGFSITNELQARPAEVHFENQQAADLFSRDTIYYPAQRIDRWPGGAYPGASPRYDGTSVLAGVKVAQQLGYFPEYRWSFGIQDLVLGLGHNGPAVLGIRWYSTNYYPDERGFIGPRGNRVGGHAILARAVKIVWRDGMSWDEHGWDAVDMDKSFITLRNSWGAWGYQDSGDCYVTLRDMDTWLADSGEAVFMLKRKTKVT